MKRKVEYTDDKGDFGKEAWRRLTLAEVSSLGLDKIAPAYKRVQKGSHIQLIPVDEAEIAALPSPAEIAKREGKKPEKVTIELEGESLRFFRQQGTRRKIPYQRLIRSVLSAYAKQHAAAVR